MGKEKGKKLKLFVGACMQKWMNIYKDGCQKKRMSDQKEKSGIGWHRRLSKGFLYIFLGIQKLVEKVS